MKRIYPIIFLLLGCITTTTAQSYYYACGEKIPLIEDSTRMTFRVPIEKGAPLKSQAAVADNDTEIIPGDDYNIVTTKLSNSNSKAQKAALAKSSPSPIIYDCYTSTNGTPLTQTGVVYLRLKEEGDTLILQDILHRYPLTLVSKDPFMPCWYTLITHADCKQQPFEIANEIYESGLVSACEPELSGIRFHCYNYNDPYHMGQWNLFGSDASINACEAWQYAMGEDVKIAIIDMGVNINHPDLSDKIVAYYDAYKNVTQPNVYPTTEKDGSLYYDHGTFCAGIAAATANNGEGIIGVAPKASIMSVSVKFHTSNEVQFANAITWAVNNGADVISCSWGGGDKSSRITEAIKNAHYHGRKGKGCVVVFRKRK